MRPGANRGPALAVVAVVLLAGCVSPEEIREEEPATPSKPPSASKPTPATPPARPPPPPPPPPPPSEVEVRGMRLYVNGTPHEVRGVTYSPVPVGWRSGLGWIHVPSTYEGDLPLIRAMGVNTLRLVASPENGTDARRFLDAASANGLHVILGVAGPMFEDAGDPTVRNATLAEVRRVVETWKDHPAVLMWMIGNEVNYLYGGDDVSDWYTLLEECARLAKSLDPSHPVGSSNSGIANATLFEALAPSVDVLGTNHYNYAPGHWEGYYFPRAKDLVPTRPLLVTEFGMDAWDSQRNVTDEETQAEVVIDHLRQIESADNSIGAVVYEWVDEWWKMGSQWEHDATDDWYPYSAGTNLPDPALSEEWFGIVEQRANSTEREPRRLYYALKDHWATTDDAPFPAWP